MPLRGDTVEWAGSSAADPKACANAAPATTTLTTMADVTLVLVHRATAAPGFAAVSSSAGRASDRDRRARQRSEKTAAVAAVLDPSLCPSMVPGPPLARSPQRGCADFFTPAVMRPSQLQHRAGNTVHDSSQDTRFEAATFKACAAPASFRARGVSQSKKNKKIEQTIKVYGRAHSSFFAR